MRRGWGQRLGRGAGAGAGKVAIIRKILRIIKLTNIFAKQFLLTITSINCIIKA